MFDYYKFKDGSLVNLTNINSIRTYNEIVPVTYNTITGETSHSIGSQTSAERMIKEDLGSSLCTVLEIVVNGHKLKMYNISKEDHDAFIKAVENSCKRIITAANVEELNNG